MPHSISLSSKVDLFQSDMDLPIDETWFEPEYWYHLQAVQNTASGRGAVWFIDSQFGQFVLRCYRRGGLIAKFNKNHFLYLGLEKTRPWLELSLLEKMRRLNLPVPRPIGGICMRKNATYSAYLLTETISDAKDLYVLIKDGLGDTVDWKKIGVTIQLFHKNGIYHSDLNCHNIMIDKNSKIWVIDFDKCDQRPINSIWPQENIDRLKRSLDKETMKYPSFMVSDSQWNAFLEGYHG